MCNCKRLISVYLKHNDTAGVSIPHLDFQKDGYLPYFGILGGDDTQLNICMDCGKIQLWRPISDEEVTGSDEYRDLGDRREILAEKKAAIAALPSGPTIITAATLEKAYIERILKDQVGEDWCKNPDVREMLESELLSTNGKTHEAVKMILEELD